MHLLLADWILFLLADWTLSPCILTGSSFSLTAVFLTAVALVAPFAGIVAMGNHNGGTRTAALT